MGTFFGNQYLALNPKPKSLNPKPEPPLLPRPVLASSVLPRGETRSYSSGKLSEFEVPAVLGFVYFGYQIKEHASLGKRAPCRGEACRDDADEVHLCSPNQRVEMVAFTLSILWTSASQLGPAHCALCKSKSILQKQGGLSTSSRSSSPCPKASVAEPAPPPPPPPPPPPNPIDPETPNPELPELQASSKYVDFRD